jgi:hypothetical protein
MNDEAAGLGEEILAANIQVMR